MHSQAWLVLFNKFLYIVLFNFCVLIFHPSPALKLIFSFTNGVDWDGPYRMQFQVPTSWQNKPFEFFNEVIEQHVSLEQ